MLLRRSLLALAATALLAPGTAAAKNLSGVVVRVDARPHAVVVATS